MWWLTENEPIHFYRNFSFCHNDFKGGQLHNVIKSTECNYNTVTLYHTIPDFTALKKKVFDNIMEKKKMLVISIFYLFNSFLPMQEHIHEQSREKYFNLMDECNTILSAYTLYRHLK